MTTITHPPITTPGVVYDMDAELYHHDPTTNGSLSHSESKLLLPPNCPALYRHHLTERDTPSVELDEGEEDPDAPAEPSAALDFGAVAHHLVLGMGDLYTVLDFKNWRTKAVKAAKKEARAAGKRPILRAQHNKAMAMAKALRGNPLADKLLSDGQPEASLFWVDEYGWRRARIDYLKHRPTRAGGRLLISDYKTCDKADISAVSRAVWNYRYHSAAAWYLDAVEAVYWDGPTEFLFVFQEKTAPYLVTPVYLDDDTLAHGRALNRQALEIWRRCWETNTWPGYCDEPVRIGLPRYAYTSLEIL